MRISREWRIQNPKLRREAMLMLLEQVYIFFVYSLLFELVIITIIAISLFIILIIKINKTNNKNTPLLGG